MVHNLDQDEMIMEVMDNAPSSWNNILTTTLYPDLRSFQSAIRYHEDALMDASAPARSTDNHYEPRRSGSKPRPQPSARVHLVGASKDLPPPRFAPDNTNVSKVTPKDKGARNCRHCDSPFHWDKECKHARKGMKTARTRLAEASKDHLEAEDEYDELYCSTLILKGPSR
ncbi:uncharacterized protein SCHCODRAFT_02673404 [Schizophyllum commune H4-8]|uniref:uncharacterized protein n=2 Tax=Schizophyllum commune (strain H4-8 / FGSC 9210) TaxID=578458 RepID=UPI00215E258D|nr:uncharacterized protein SCHCODRAFT_02673404 [Schizophyllum commune H4-8]KAI5885681.1 hypothetical protein SCHCODRAFT_02673404 [Schizophyllum commune H4-8]